MFERKFNELFFGLFQEFPKSTLDFGKVKRLNLISETEINHLNSFADQLYKFKKLKELFIHTEINYSKDLPKEIGDLKTLRKLRILNYPFKEFPLWVLKLKNLEELLIRGNELEKFPEEIRKLSKLKTLRIENCELKEVPNGIFNLKNLEYLSFQGTKLENVDVRKLPENLKTLNLNWCSNLDQNISNHKTKFNIIK